MNRSSRRLLAGLLVTATATLTACGAGPARSAGPDGSESAAQGIPASIRESGVLRVGTNVPFVPMEYMKPDNTTFTGIDIDLMRAVGDRLGLKVQFTNASWDSLIPSLSAGRYDVLASSFGDFVQRRKQVDFVDMLEGGIAGVVPSAKRAKYPDAAAVCGKTVGVENGSATVEVALTLSARCTKAGRAAVTSRVYPSDSNAVVALQSGRIDMVLDDRVVAEHLTATQAGRYAMVLDKATPAFLYGFVVSKTNRSLSEAVMKALNSLIADGTYAKICARYGITGSSLLTKATLNAGTRKEG